MRRALLVLLLIPLSAQADYRDHAKVPELFDNLRRNYAFSEAELQDVRNALAEAQRLPQLVEAEQKAPEKTENWTQYSRRIDESRVQGALKVIREQADSFARAESEFGVPPPVIAAIIGVETSYGNITGRIRVLDSLSTQGFDHPTRAPFFFGELAEFFAFCRDFGFAPSAPQGSYAGAMGAAQFMPSNYRRLALDYDGDGRRDLWTLPDAIGSIAHYFVSYKPELAWQRGEPLAVRARLTRELPAGIERNTRTPMYSAGDLQLAGLVPEVALPPQTPVGVVELPLDGGASEYWIALPNFYTVMTYNPRTFYAMAVTQLAQRIEQMQEQAAQAEAP